MKNSLDLEEDVQWVTTTWNQSVGNQLDFSNMCQRHESACMPEGRGAEFVPLTWSFGYLCKTCIFALSEFQRNNQYYWWANKSDCRILGVGMTPQST